MSSNQSNNNSVTESSESETERYQQGGGTPPPPPPIKKKVRKVRCDKGKGKKKKNVFVTKSPSPSPSPSPAVTDNDEVVTDIDAEVEVTPPPDLVETVEQSNEIATAVVTSIKAKKGAKYTDAEVAEVRAITDVKNNKSVTLTHKQLIIAYWIESEDIKEKNKIAKEQGCKISKSDKASFCITASCDKAFFVELQKRFKTEDGEPYTLQAIQHSIQHYFFTHFNIGNAYARSGGYTQYHTTKSGNEKIIGCDIPDEFFTTEDAGFLRGYLLTDEGKKQLEIGEEAQRVKRTTNKSVKGTNDTKEARARNLKQATDKMADDELSQQIALLMAEAEKRKNNNGNSEVEDENGSSAY